MNVPLLIDDATAYVLVFALMPTLLLLAWPVAEWLSGTPDRSGKRNRPSRRGT